MTRKTTTPRKPTRKEILDQILDRVLPATFADQVGDLFLTSARAAVRRELRVYPGVTGHELARAQQDLTARLGDPERMRRALRRWLDRQLGPTPTAAEVRTLRRAAEERVTAALAARVEKLLPRITAQLDARLDQALTEHLEALALHRFVTRFGWTRGAEPLRSIADDPACGLGTALLIYWLGLPHELRPTKSRRDVPLSQRQHHDLLRRIERRAARGGYRHAGIEFDPRDLDARIDPGLLPPHAIWSTLPEPVRQVTLANGSVEPLPVEKPPRRRPRGVQKS
jgi:hypothetical protein